MGSKFIFTTTTLAVLSIFFSSKPIHFFRPPPIPGAYDKLEYAQIIRVAGAVGPESLAFDPNGEGPYTGVADGRIIKWQEGQGWINFAVTSPHRGKECVHPSEPETEHVCGRPLGLRFHSKTGELYITDAYFGLQMVGPSGGLATQLITKAEDEPFLLTNNLDIDEQEDVIYFTDSSTTFQRREFMLAILIGDKTGRLMKYDISSKKVKVLLRGLAFANGVALSKDKSFVLIAESANRRILRLWLQGPKAGSNEIFAELPGFPDNIRMNSKGEFWVALHSKTGTIEKWVLSNTWVGKILLKLPSFFKQLTSLFSMLKAHGTVIKLNEEGQVVEVLEDSQGRAIRFISEVQEVNGNLWIGSVLMPFIGRYKLY